MMKVKCLEIRDCATFIPVICIEPVADNDRQAYLLRRDGYAGSDCIIMIDYQCRGVQNDPYDWPDSRTKRVAHEFIEKNWDSLADGDVIDVEFILGESTTKKVSERFGG